MKIKVLLLLISISFMSNAFAKTDENMTNTTMIQTDSLLRHTVFFKFKEGTTAEQIKKVEDTFSALPSKIEQIKGYEWGLNNSPEGLNKGFTHAFFLTFESEEDRAIYLPHPDHKAFGAVLTPFLDDVFVVDYWTKP
ncbi:stress responsive alpha/beta barrel protein [Maribacter spongiicola]|uniref:Stress responsive alpha/beta barrel protein n=1 Tax=Maribacter spongiicola TaxID=1206753 RepID=A0A4V6Q2S5_9FLAO|nr:Dabb family protein [Maribacter spongiicola]TDT47463.1 stress responsive alpha/beta barrel protein [Maribacter spongiicola]